MKPLAFHTRFQSVLLLIVAVLASGRSTAIAQTAVSHSDAKSARGLVVSVSIEASEAGAQVLRDGGNAVDAAVATAFALAVTYPPAGNIGGGGFMMIHESASGKTVCVDYRETAPLKATIDTYRRLTSTGRGALSAGVPGTVRGLELAHQKHGKLPWPRLLEPAIQLARQGFPVDAHVASSLNRWRPALKQYLEAQRVYFANEAAWKAGNRLVQPALAGTLELIAKDGARAFYEGLIADQIVVQMNDLDGLISHADLRAYQAVLRTPVSGTYRAHQVFAPPPPSSGGIALIQMLNMLETQDRAAAPRDSAAAAHRMIEAMRRAYLDRARHVGDPDFVTVPVERLTSKAYARELVASTPLDRATPSSELGKDILMKPEGPSTTHFSVIDADGNAVSNTYTLQDSYGSFVVVKGAGFLLNNEMTDFNLEPGSTTSAGQIGTPANVIAPGKRMLSSQTPTIVLKDGRVRVVTGSPGGRTIINTVLHVVTAVIDEGQTARQAVDAPRMHHQWMPDVTRSEAGRFTDEALESLREMGHRIETSGRQGDAHTIVVDPAIGLRHGAADKRLSGKASAE